MKRLLLFICTLLCANVLSAQAFWVRNLQYSVTSTNPPEVSVYDCPSYSSSATIPPLVSYNNITYSVTYIDDYAFKDCSSLTSIYIPNSVTSIGYMAFENCRLLTSVTIPNSVTSIGTAAFRECSRLTSVSIGNSVTSIGDNTFYNCSSLTSITIPNSVTSIGESAFRSCSSLTSVTIPNSVTSIGEAAFAFCNSLTSITIPNGVSSIGSSTFCGCSSLASVNIPNSVTSIGNSAFYNCDFTSITIPNSVTSIGDEAFEDCSSLTSITIPNSVTSIGGGVFYGCSSLTSITLSNNITSLSTYDYDYYYDYHGFFEDCSSLTTITIPNSVTSIGDEAFKNCSSLTSVTCLATIPPNIGNYVFHYPNTLTLSVPCVSLDAYSSPTSLWNMFFSDRISGIEYNVVANVNNADFGSVAIENNCSTATLTATATACYQFVGWNDGNTENPRIVTLSSDTTLTANFGVIVNDIITSICQGQVYNENGFEVSEAGVYTQTLTSVNGCDSTVTLTLNVNPHHNTELTATICEGSVYTENNFNVSEAGVYTQTLQTVNGCDSIVTLTLNVNPIFNTELSATICQGQAYTENGFNVSEAGVYTQTLTAVNGCDSIVTLTVSVNPTFDTTINATINPGETYAEFGFNESEAGTYVQNLQTEAGCDSTITLVLSVNSSLLEAEIEEISFYPNPTDSKVTFSQAIEKVEVINLIGKTIFTFTNAKTINIESLPAGVYYLRLTNNDKAIMQKVIKE